MLEMTVRSAGGASSATDSIRAQSTESSGLNSNAPTIGREKSSRMYTTSRAVSERRASTGTSYPIAAARPL